MSLAQSVAYNEVSVWIKFVYSFIIPFHEHLSDLGVLFLGEMSNLNIEQPHYSPDTCIGRL